MKIGATMMHIKPWEVWLASVRFEDQPNQSKKRPVVVTSAGEIFVLALKVTSHSPRLVWGEYALTEWRFAGLSKPSTVRVGKPLRLDAGDMVFRMGALHPLDIIAIQSILSTKK